MTEGHARFHCDWLPRRIPGRAGTAALGVRTRGMSRGSMLRVLRRVAVLVGGGALLAVGVAMIVLPGPAVVVIPAAIGVLAIEFEWARRWLRSIRATALRARQALRGKSESGPHRGA